MLEGPEYDLWRRMPTVDQRHSVRVFDRFTDLLPDATKTERAAVLLHDVGKSASCLGIASRVLATVGLLWTRRARDYRCHEAIGIELARGAGVATAVLDAMAGGGRRDFREAFRLADDE